VAAAAADHDVASDLYFMLNALQHRGQEAAGIATYQPDEQCIGCCRGLGLVNEAFKDVDVGGIHGQRGIAHVYYSIELSTPENAQPTLVHTSSGDIALAHNGIITNAGMLRRELMEQGHTFSMGSEEESIAFMLSDQLKDTGFEKAVRYVMKRLEGSYSLTIMYNDRVFGLRDPLGVRPLCLGELPDGYLVASESVALDSLGATFIRDVRPGELVEITPDGYNGQQLVTARHTAHCFFEYVYFSRADSVIDDKDVYQVRKRIGGQLAAEHPVEADIVVPVPDSGRAHAYGYAHAADIQLAEGLMKNRYIGRTFIMPSQRLREKYVLLKMNPVQSIVSGRRVVIVDDSIVRGTTMRQMVDILRQRGAEEVHVRIGSPPILAPCYFGIDMTDRKQLIASDKSVDAIQETIGADSLGYISIDGLLKATGFSRNELCLGCVTGEYPVDVEGESYRFQEKLESYG